MSLKWNYSTEGIQYNQCMGCGKVIIYHALPRGHLVLIYHAKHGPHFIGSEPNMADAYTSYTNRVSFPPLNVTVEKTNQTHW